MRVGAAGEDVVAAFEQPGRECIGVGAHLPLVVAERSAHRDLEAGRLRGDRVHQRAALHAREVRPVDLGGVLGAAEHEPGARAGQRLVRRRGDEVAVRHRARVETRGDQAGEVRHVAHQERTHLVGDLAEAVGLDGAGIGRAAAHDQRRPHLLRLSEQLVVVDQHRLAGDAVVVELVELPGEVDLQAVGQMAAVVEREAEHAVAGLQDGEVHRHVRLCARMCLHVRVLGAEQLGRTVARDLLDLVDDLAAAVVALARVALRVLVRRHRADSLEHARPREVLGGDQLDLAALAIELTLEQLCDLRVDLREPERLQLVERLVGDRHHPDRTRALRMRAIASADGDAPSRSTRGSGPVRSSTVDGVPGSVPPSSAGQAARSRSGTSASVRGSGPPGSLALVAATQPTAASTRRASSERFGTRTPIASLPEPASQRKRRDGFGSTSVNGPGSSVA